MTCNRYVHTSQITHQWVRPKVYPLLVSLIYLELTLLYSFHVQAPTCLVLLNFMPMFLYVIAGACPGRWERLAQFRWGMAPAWDTCGALFHVRFHRILYQSAFSGAS